MFSLKGMFESMGGAEVVLESHLIISYCGNCNL